ncbi:MAG: hypothetical protein CM15mL8_410 [Caudoviricetes sp.]|nr:MAG: hypothetical protein CM15mL8_410 [Caudoviricetes sp.]
MSDSNWNKTGIHYLVIGHACDEEQESHVMFFYDEVPTSYIEKKFIDKVKENLENWEKDKEIYIDFILKSISPIQVQYE